MTDTIYAVMQRLAAGDTIHTRLRETATGDVHDLPGIDVLTLGVSWSPAYLLAALEALEQRGVVVQTETVHPYDSTEYVITWRNAGGRRAPPFFVFPDNIGVYLIRSSVREDISFPHCITKEYDHES
jgi:hypothetical protein